MGLDSVELVMAIEERFAITIPDEEAEKMITPRAVIDYVYSQVKHTEAKLCLSQRAFYRLRRSLQTEFALPRSAIAPATLLESVIPMAGRPENWSRLRNTLAIKHWPDLVRSSGLIAWLALAVLTAGIAAGLMSPVEKILTGIAVAIGTSIALKHATQSRRLHFREPATVGQLAEFMVAHGAGVIHSGEDAGQVWTREQVRTAVRSIIVEYLNVEPTFSDDASFVDDLGLS